MKAIMLQGRSIYKLPDGKEKEERIKNQIFMLRFIQGNCPRGLVQSSGGILQLNAARIITDIANGQFIKAYKDADQQGEPFPVPYELQTENE